MCATNNQPSLGPNKCLVVFDNLTILENNLFSEDKKVLNTSMQSFITKLMYKCLSNMVRVLIIINFYFILKY